MTKEYHEIENRDELLEKYVSDINKLNDMYLELSNEILLFLPDLSNAWTIKDHLIHIADTEVNCFLRYKRSLINPGAVINFGGGDVEKSNILLNYTHADIEDYMSLFRIIRKILYEEVKILSNDELTMNYILHPDYGKCNIKYILSIYTQHIEKHIEMIKRNIILYNKKY